jgi:hypothetical protein
MVAAQANHETVFSVLGESARRRGARTLSAQLVLSVVTGASILLAAPQWWSIACLAGWSAAYSAWGLIVRRVEAKPAHARVLDAVLATIAATGATLAFVGLIGLAMALFTGTGKSPYNACGQGATDARCQALDKPPVTKGPIVR